MKRKTPCWAHGWKTYTEAEGHNCPTPIRCAIRKAFDRAGWLLIHIAISNAWGTR